MSSRQGGDAEPEWEADMASEQEVSLQYRCEDGALAIFGLHRPHLVVTRFAAETGAFPVAEDRRAAVARWKRWVAANG
jgi:hypothetical protein